MSKDQVKDHITEVQGQAKEVTGTVIGDTALEFKGKLERAGGKSEGLYGNVKASLKKSSGPMTRWAARSPSDRRNEMNMPIIPTVFGTRTFLGDEIYNRREDRLGILKEFMLDLHSGRICYAVMSSGGFLGVGEKLFAIPWRALTLDAKNARLVLDIAEERLMSSPGFDKRHWPDMSDAAWVQDIDTFYGIPPETRAKTGNPA